MMITTVCNLRYCLLSDDDSPRSLSRPDADAARPKRVGREEGTASRHPPTCSIGDSAAASWVYKSPRRTISPFQYSSWRAPYRVTLVLSRRTTSLDLASRIIPNSFNKFDPHSFPISRSNSTFSVCAPCFEEVTEFVLERWVHFFSFESRVSTSYPVNRNYLIAFRLLRSARVRSGRGWGDDIFPPKKETDRFFIC